MLNGRSILLTGGTGSFGRKFTQVVLSRYPDLERLVIFSRGEMKQFEMAKDFPEQDCPQIRYFIGDVRDKDRLWRAMEGIDTVIHAAALKQVPVCEYNPQEAIKTNILGAMNVIESAIDRGVKHVVALSTDKAAAPINLYGATKLCSDKLFVAGNKLKGAHDIRFSVVRYGNVMGSRGSVIPFFLKQREKGVIPITDERMTRFNIMLEDGVELVLFALEDMRGGELYIPKIPSYRITDVAEAVAPGVPTKIIGIRPGEKLHEEMITETDAMNTLEFEDHFVMLPAVSAEGLEEYVKESGGKLCGPGFHYSSGTNDSWLSVDEIRRLVKEYVDTDLER